MLIDLAQRIQLAQIRDKWVERATRYFHDETIRGEQGFLTSVALLRLSVALTVTLGALLFPHDFLSLNRELAILILATYLSVSLTLVYLRFRAPELFLCAGSKFFQVVFDILGAVLILSIHDDLNSILFLMFAAPALVAGRYFSFRRFIFVFLLIAVGLFAGQLYTNSLLQTPYDYTGLVVKVWFPRIFVLAVVGFFALFYRNVKQIVLDDKQLIIKRQLEIGTALRTTAEVDALVKSVCREAVRTVLGARSGVLHLVEGEDSHLFSQAYYPEGLGFRFDEDLAAQSLKEREVVHISRILDSWFQAGSNSPVYQSLLIAPLYVANKAIGTISLESPNPHAFSEVSEQQLMVLAAMASSALANAIEFERRQRKHMQLQEILMFGQARLVPKKGLGQLIDQVISGVKEVLGYENAEVYAFGFIPRRLPGINVEQFDMRALLASKDTQQALLNMVSTSRDYFAFQRSSRHLLPTEYRLCVPLLGTENQAIGVLILGHDRPFSHDRDTSQSIWIYAREVARDVEVAISLELEAKLQESLASLEETANSEQHAAILAQGFKQLGFQSGVLKMAPIPGGPKEEFISFGVVPQELEVIKGHLLAGRNTWIRQHSRQLRACKLIEHVFYFPWQDEWVRREFDQGDLSMRGDKGFLYVYGAGSMHRYVFEALLGITEEMESPTENWARSLRLFVDTTARSIESVRLAATQAAAEAIREEREWLQGDIHTSLNLIQGGPLLFSEAARKALSNTSCSGRQEDTILVAVEHLSAAEKASRFAYQHLSQLMEELRQPTLRDKGLCEALRDCADALGLRKRLTVSISPAHEKQLDLKTKYVLHRIALEAISNAQKHAHILDKADGRVEVSLRPSSSGEWKFVIWNNGDAFEEPVEDVSKRLMSFGLRQMSSWARKINGEFRIQTSAESTAVEVAIPTHLLGEEEEVFYSPS